MSHSYRDLFSVHLKYIDYLLDKTLTIHQYASDIKESGNQVEVEIRKLLRSFLPARYRVTHGYVVSATDRYTEPSVSPQVDVIVVDTLVPHSLWVVDEVQGAEIVPAEAVIGVIEVKRTLTPNSLEEAIDHLGDIFIRANLTKTSTAKYAPGGIQIGMGLNGGYHSNPLCGILALQLHADLAKDIERLSTTLRAAVERSTIPIDIIATLTGVMFATASRESGKFETVTARAVDTPKVYSSEYAPLGKNRQVVFGKVVGYISAYLSQVCGRSANPDAYFFNAYISDVQQTP